MLVSQRLKLPPSPGRTFALGTLLWARRFCVVLVCCCGLVKAPWKTGWDHFLNATCVEARDGSHSSAPWTGRAHQTLCSLMLSTLKILRWRDYKAAEEAGSVKHLHREHSEYTFHGSGKRPSTRSTSKAASSVFPSMLRLGSECCCAGQPSAKSISLAPHWPVMKPGLRLAVK